MYFIPNFLLLLKEFFFISTPQPNIGFATDKKSTQREISKNIVLELRTFVLANCDLDLTTAQRASRGVMQLLEMTLIRRLPTIPPARRRGRKVISS